MEILKQLLILLAVAEGLYIVMILFIALLSYEYTGNYKIFFLDILIPYYRFYRERKKNKEKNITK